MVTGIGADERLDGTEVPERLVRDVVGAQRCHQVAGARTPHADAAGAAGDVAHGHAAVGQPTGDPVHVQRSVRADLEQVGVQPGDGEIASDAAGFVEHEGVGDRAVALVDVVGGQPLQELAGTRSAHLVAGQRRHVVERHVLAGPPGLGDRDRRIEPAGPVVTFGEFHSRRGQFGHQRGVGLVPGRPFPAPTLEEVGAEVELALMERADAQVRGARPGTDAGG